MDGPTWKEVLVAVAFMGFISSIVLTAILRYDVDGALKVWAALGPVIGFLTGTVLARFFGSGK